MSKKQILIAVLVLSALAQLAVPCYMIYKHEKVLTQGKVYKFKCSPVDPYDAMRGKYVALRIEGTSVPAENIPAGRHNELYVLVGTDPVTGFAKMQKAVKDEPKNGDYFKCKTNRYDSGKTVFVEVPFDRYYMNEDLAPLAEQAYREHTRRGKQSDAYVTVRIGGGRAVLEELYVDGVTMKEFLSKK